MIGFNFNVQFHVVVDSLEKIWKMKNQIPKMEYENLDDILKNLDSKKVFSCDVMDAFERLIDEIHLKKIKFKQFSKLCSYFFSMYEFNFFEEFVEERSK